MMTLPLPNSMNSVDTLLLELEARALYTAVNSAMEFQLVCCTFSTLLSLLLKGTHFS